MRKLYKLGVQKVSFVFFFSLFTSLALGQATYHFSTGQQTFIGSNNELPFWMFHNTRGRISGETNYVGVLRAEANWDMGSLQRISVGTGSYFQDQNNKFYLEELFLAYANADFGIILGSKQKPVFYNGLSATNQNILWSLNARPLPGIQLGTTKPIIVFPSIGLGFEAAWEEYMMEEDRHVSRAKLHHKSFHFVFKASGNLQLKAGLQHFVQWGGTSRTFGAQPNDFNDYLKILIGASGDENAVEGDQQNALGNNLGSYEFEIAYNFPRQQVMLVYNSIFEDGSGRRLGNTPDGRYGIFVQKRKTGSIINSFMYELYYTKHQSHTTTGSHKFDNYFNNGGYQSGWTYHGVTIGAPFFLENENANGIYNNRFVVHHIGVEGNFSKTKNYHFLLSYRKNYGTDGTGLYHTTENILSSSMQVNLVKSWFKLDLQLAADLARGTDPNFGLGLNFSMRTF